MANQGVEFSVADLSLFTHNFSISLGNGACGAVFRGEIPAENDYGLGQQKIAVKQFVVSDKAAQQWMVEQDIRHICLHLILVKEGSFLGLQFYLVRLKKKTKFLKII